jgi:hypothetical protein
MQSFTPRSFLGPPKIAVLIKLSRYDQITNNYRARCLVFTLLRKFGDFDRSREGYSTGSLSVDYD